nr:2-dehydropantoate 2-reductase [Rhizobium sp. Q54]
MMKRTVNETRICVAGAGAIGIALTARLLIGGFRAVLVARDESVRFIRKNGLRFIDLEGRHHLYPEVDHASGFSAADILFLCSKSQDLPKLSLSVQHLIVSGKETPSGAADGGGISRTYEFSECEDLCLDLRLALG